MRTRTIRSRGWRRLALLVVAALTPLAAPAAPALAEDPPVVTAAAVTPTTLDYLGGTVTVTAYVMHDFPLNIVYADIGGPYNLGQAALTTDDGFQYFGTVELPANYSPNSMNWQIWVRARDLDNVEGAGYAGEVQVTRQPPNEPPVLSDPSVAPQSLSSSGGPVTLAVTATDAGGISDAYATVTGPAGVATRVQLTSTGADRFDGVFDAPANPGTSAAQYAVEMTAMDDYGLPASVDAGVITVAGQPSGRLQLNRVSLGFGATVIGSHTRRSIVVRNVGPRSSAPVDGIVTTSGAPFFIAGAPATGLPFHLRPGRALTVLVTFRPRAKGAQTGTLTVSRPDLVQPDLAVPLYGRGIARS